VIRPIEAGDVEGLSALYAALDFDDRHRRFFSSFRPGRAFLEHMTTVADRGGVGLVAVVADGEPAGPGIVGEAGYELLANGDGEMAITVAERWRGWLGPYLLDALVSAADRRGVPNLEADVLTTNRPMVALARARGAVSVPQPDWTSVRLLIGTASRTPTWPALHDRPRVLIEGDASRWRVEPEAGAAPLEVLACPGPIGRSTRCPALEGRPCPLAAGADAIVVSATSDDDDWPSLVDAHRLLHPGVPVCIAGSRARAPSSVEPPADDDREVIGLVQRHLHGVAF
jgi:hypothetical protein